MPHKYRSTSSPQLCGDVKLSIKEKIRYIWINYKNNKSNLCALDERIIFKKFSPKIRTNQISQVGNIPPSPSRYLSNEFWRDCDLDFLLESNGPLRVLEVGCGTGIYGLELQRKLGDKLKLYRGVDILRHSSWDDMPHNFEFYQAKAEDIAPYLTDIDLIITQSAIEHFEYDLSFFHQIVNYISNSNHIVWQIHLLPSAECLKTYLWHGYRQYTYRNLSKITKLFSDNSAISVYCLGGKYANKLHLWMITLPNFLLRVDLRALFPRWYWRMLINSISKDLTHQQTASSFYGLMIKSEKTS